MKAKELAIRWGCEIRVLGLLQRKGIIIPRQKTTRWERDFPLSQIEQVEKEYGIITEYITIEAFAKKYNLHYNTVYKWVRDGKIPACKLFKPVRIPVDAKPSTRVKE